MPAPLDCPGVECWQAVFDGTLSPEQRADYERHLESCPSCQARLDRAAPDADALLTLVREVGSPTAAPDDPALSRCLQRLRDEASPLRPAPPEPADLYFLRPADRPGLLGLLGTYEVRWVIGAGGMGVVLKAFDPALHRLVAIKVLSPALAGSATARRRFTREAQAAAAVCHEHVVPVHGVGEVDGLPYVVMQYIAGESLQQRLDRTGPLEVPEVVQIGLQTAQGLAAAHAQGLIHRDVKPANLLLEDGLARVKVTDFGLARTADDVGLTQAGVVAGTPEYMAPEQARGEALDHRADLFSLGSVLYACCTGGPPFRGGSAVAVLRRVSDEAPAPVRSRNPDVPAWLEGLIARLLAKDPAERFQSAGEVAALLERYLGHLRQPEPVPAPELPPRAAQTGRRAARGLGRRNGCLLLLAGLLALGLGAPLVLHGLLPAALPPGAEISQDFRGGQPLPPWLTLDGGDADEVARLEADGLRITMPPTRTRTGPVGVALTVSLSGDFEITGRYEILSADPPPRGNGVGVALNVAPDGDLQQFGKVGRFLRPGEGSVYVVESWNREQPGNSHCDCTPSQVRTGRLRLVREGSTLHYLAADESSDEFRELAKREFTKEDVGLARFVVNNSGSPAGIDARLLELKVRSGGLVPQGPFDPSKAGVAVAEALGLGLPLLVGVAVGVVLYVRRRRKAGTPAGPPAADQGAKPEAAPAPVPFACPGCGRRLKARAVLAGKEVKCPQCGRAVLVPRPEASEAGRPAGAPSSEAFVRKGQPPRD